MPLSTNLPIHFDHIARLGNNIAPTNTMKEGGVVAKRVQYTQKLKNDFRQLYEKDKATKTLVQIVQEYKLAIPYTTAQKWITDRETDELAESALHAPDRIRRPYKKKSRKPRMQSKLEQAMVEYIMESNEKRGTQDINWTSNKLLSVAAMLRSKVATEVRPLDRSFADKFYQAHTDICIRNPETDARAAELTAIIKSKQAVGQKEAVEIRVVKGKGYGLFTTRDFRKGEVIARYGGVEVPKETIEKPTYDSSYVWSTRNDTRCVDAHHAEESGFGGYINEAFDKEEFCAASDSDDSASSGANCKIELYRGANLSRTTEGDILVKCLKNRLKAGTELLTSYGSGYWSELIDADALPPGLTTAALAAFNLPRPRVRLTFVHSRDYVPLGDRAYTSDNA